MLKSAVCNSPGPGSGSPSQFTHPERPNLKFLELPPSLPNWISGNPVAFRWQSPPSKLFEIMFTSSPLIVPITSVKKVQSRNGSPPSQSPYSHLGQFNGPLPPAKEQLSKDTGLLAMKLTSSVPFACAGSRNPILINVPLKLSLSMTPSLLKSSKNTFRNPSSGTHLAVPMFLVLTATKK